jgi:hypothetical protein
MRAVYLSDAGLADLQDKYKPENKNGVVQYTDAICFRF